MWFVTLAGILLAGSVVTAPCFVAGGSVGPDSATVLPVETIGRSDFAEEAVLDLELAIVPRVMSSSTIEIRVTVSNEGRTPFWVPDNLASPGGDLNVVWRSEDGQQTTRRLILGTGPRCGSNMVSDYVYLPPSAYYGRQISLRYKERPVFVDPADTRDHWPPGDYEFRVRMSLADGDASRGVPRGIFETSVVRVTVVD